MYRHIVLFRVHDDVPDGRIEGVIDVLATFALFPGVVSWHVERSLDERKGRIIIEDAVFDGRVSFEAFTQDPGHRAVGEDMAKIADWWIGDYETG